MADYTQTPFSRVFNPDNAGTLTGMLGRAAGNPTGSERQGATTGRALQILQELRDKGMSPQKAISQFINTPEGIQLFTSDPNLLDTLTKYTQALTPPKPTITQGSPGNTIFSTGADGKTVEVGHVPTAEVQTFNDLAKVAKLPPDELANMAKINMLPAGQKDNEKVAAVQRLVRSGTISPEVGDKITAGIYQVVQTKDQFGNLTGSMVLDTSTGQAIGPGASQPPAPGGGVSTVTPRPNVNPADPAQAPSSGVLPQPGAKPLINGREPPKGAVTPDGNVLPDKMWDDKRTMFLGTGITPMAAGALDTIMRQVEPSVGFEPGRQAKSQRSYLNQVHHAFTTIQKDVDSMGYNKAVIETAKPLLPGVGITEDPLNATANGIKLYDLTQQEKNANLAATRDERLPIEERKRAAHRLEGWDRVARALPERQEMVDLYEAIKKGEAGLGMKRTLQAGEAAAEKAVRGQNIGEMSAKQLLTLKPQELSAQERVALRKRLDQLLSQQPKAK